MTSFNDIITTVQNGVIAINGFAKQLNKSLGDISTSLTTLTSQVSTILGAYVTSIAGNHGAFTLNSTSGITNTVNDIQLQQGSASQFGAVKVDGTTITATAGVISVPATAQYFKLLNTLTAANSATLSDTTSLTASFSTYEIIFTELVPATNNVALELQVHSGGAFKTTGYLSAGFTVTSTGGTAATSQTTNIGMGFGGNIGNASPGISGTVRVYNPSANQISHWTGQSDAFRSGNTINDCVYFSGAWNTAGVIDGFQILFSAGNITSGTVKIYGIL